MKIQHPLPAPTPAEIELAKTDADARKRVRNQMLRVKRRDEEIADAERVKSLTLDLSVTATDTILSGGDGDYPGDYGGADYDCDDDRYVRISPECCNVLCRSIRTRSSVLAHWFAIAGFLPVRTEQHT